MYFFLQSSLPAIAELHNNCLPYRTELVGRETESVSLLMPEDIAYLKRTTFSGHHPGYQFIPQMPPAFPQLLIKSLFLQQEAQEITVHSEYRIVHIQSIYCGKTIHRFPLKDFFPCVGTNGLSVKNGKTISCFGKDIE